MRHGRGATRARRAASAGLLVAVLVATVAGTGTAGGAGQTTSPRRAGAPRSADVAAAATESDNAIGDLFGDVIMGTVTGGSTSVFGWSLSAMGLNNDDGAEFAEISAQLATISDQLTEISAQLSAIEDELDQQTCDLETAETTQAARTDIDTLMDTYNGFLAQGATDEEIQAFVESILGGSGNGGVSLETELVSIDEALLNVATAQGVIAACAVATAEPTTDTMGSTDYYDELNNLVMYFYAYQTNGLMLLTEAYHYLATESWEESNSSSSISPTAAQTICTDATGNVAIYCGQAAQFVDDIYDNLQDQFALSGAPYDVEGQSALLNGTTYLFTLSLEDYTNQVSPSNTCTQPLTYAAPCGPTSGTNLQTFTGQTYAGRDDWTPATGPMLGQLLAGWTDTSDTAGDYLDDFGFFDMEDKILVTPTTYTATPDCGDTCTPSGTIFSLTAACFVDTSVALSHSQQPFCYNGETTDGVKYGNSIELLGGRGYWDDGNCLSFSSSDWLASGAAADDFYTGTYDSHLGIEPCSPSWVDGVELGWILDGGSTKTQYLMPMFDTSTATCTTNEDGTSRSITNTEGIPTMCGTDFDTWFSSIVPSPYTSDSATVTVDSDSSSTADVSTAAVGRAPSFQPRYVSIRPGGTVTWVQSGRGEHTVVADDGAFRSTTRSGGSFTHTFTHVGAVRYHEERGGGSGGAGMAGTVFVLSSRGPTPARVTPRFTG